MISDSEVVPVTETNIMSKSHGTSTCHVVCQARTCQSKPFKGKGCFVGICGACIACLLGHYCSRLSA